METILKKYFGYSAFREGQEEIIKQIISGRDALIIMPTGGGKSICYQVPAMMLGGVTVVISPLIALMKDQVEALVQNGISATFLNSSLNALEIRDRIAGIEEGQYKLIYVAPEALMTSQIQRLTRQLDIQLVAVDEAHCISQWGHDFRPSYKDIAVWINQLSKRPIIAAFTATATKEVRSDILDLLSLESPFITITGVKRENLIYKVVKPTKKYDYLKEWFEKVPKEHTGIIYCATRKTVESLTDKLKKEGFSVAAYHAGMSTEARNKTQDAFMLDKKQIIVATNAFGMGIDKPDVRFVIHYNMPKNMEAYYQEAGRAGRDGEESECLLMYDASDIVKQKLLIAQGTNDPIRYRMMLSNLQALVQYCHTSACLNGEIMRYFGEANPETQCGYCGNCLDTSELVDQTLASQKLLSCVYRVGQRYGMNLVIDVLRGSKAQKIMDLKLNEVSTYGIMKDKSIPELKDLTMFLIAEGYLSITRDEYPVLKLNAMSQEVLKGNKTVMMKQSQRHVSMSKSKKSKSKNSKGHSGSNPVLYEALADLRKSIAEVKKVPLYIIFSNAVLEEIAAIMPVTKAEFIEIKGIGEKKYDLYGERFMEVVRELKLKG